VSGYSAVVEDKMQNKIQSAKTYDAEYKSGKMHVNKHFSAENEAKTTTGATNATLYTQCK